MAQDASSPLPGGSIDLHLLDFHARIVAPPATLAALATIFPPGPTWLAGRSDVAPVRFDVRAPEDAVDRYLITREGTAVWETADPADLVGPLEWAVTSAALERLAARHVLFHGGAVALAERSGERGILMPAASGSGKTTLVAGLIAAGFRYLSDEVSILDPAGPDPDGASEPALLPFPRALCVKVSSRPILARLYPEFAASPTYARFAGERVSYLVPPASGWPAAPVPVRAVVLPRYVAGAVTSLQTIPRPVALRALLEQSFSAHRQGAAAVTAIVDLLRDVPCFALTIGDLTAAVDALRQLPVG